jgi:hypothetical protein
MVAGPNYTQETERHETSANTFETQRDGAAEEILNFKFEILNSKSCSSVLLIHQNLLNPR